MILFAALSRLKELRKFRLEKDINITAITANTGPAKTHISFPGPDNLQLEEKITIHCQDAEKKGDIQCSELFFSVRYLGIVHLHGLLVLLGCVVAFASLKTVTLSASI